MPRPQFAPLLAPLMLALLAGPAAAESVRVYGAGEAVDPAEVARILAPAPKAPKMRGLRLLDDRAASTVALAVPPAPSAEGSEADDATVPVPLPATPSRPRRPVDGDAGSGSSVAGGSAGAAGGEVEVASSAGTAALSLPVPFAFDSSDILPDARPQLDALAQGLMRLPQERRIVIEGHTDAAGSQPYNERLSMRRAQAVKRYLVAVHRIDPSRLLAVGLGEFAPLEGTDPMAARNRRVQFRGQ